MNTACHVFTSLAMKFKKITNHPVPLYAVECPPHSARHALAEELEDWCREWVPDTMRCRARGVELERLPTILKNGCDVEPVDAPLFVAHLKKAIEYGANGDQIVQFFRSQRLKRTWVEKPSSIGDDEKEELRKTYPTVLTSRDGKLLWFTRLAEDDPRSTKDYEKCYGAWIPGDPFDALTCIIVLGARLHDVISHCVAALREAKEPQAGR
jgi:hypothetical protein